MARFFRRHRGDDTLGKGRPGGLGMTMSFLNRSLGQGDQIVAIDLSTPVTKAVHVRRNENGLALLMENYCLQKAPFEEQGRSVKQLAEHLKSVHQALKTKTRDIVLIVGMEDSTLRHVESPLMERNEMRHALTLNARQFFREDMPDCVFDCFTPPLKKGDANAAARPGKHPVLVSIVKQELPRELNSAAKLAGLNLIRIVPAQIGLANAALQGTAKANPKEALLLVHVGPNTTTVSFLSKGTLVLTRAIGIGGDHLSRGLAEAYDVSSSSEQAKIALIQTNVQAVLEPLAFDIRGAIDYFENLDGCPITTGYITGDLVQSRLVVETLKALEIPCQRLDPTTFLGVTLGIESDLETDLPQLDVVVGGAVGHLNPEAIDLNLLAEEVEIAALRRRDPVRWTVKGAIGVTLFLLLWTAWVLLQTMRADRELRRERAEWTSLEKAHREAIATLKKVREVEQTVAPLEQHATNRFLWTLPLNALQGAMLDDIQLVGLRMEQTLTHQDPVKSTNSAAVQPAQTKEQIAIIITAKNFSDNQAEDKFIEHIAALPYFKNSLRKKEPVMLKNRLLRQVDPLDPTKTFTLFTIECVYPERVLGHD
jgi:Tfp pilus assembly PilM family ATPase